MAVMANVWIVVAALTLPVGLAEKHSEDFVVTEGVANFLTDVMLQVFNATRVEIVVSSNYIASTTVRITSNETALGLVKRVYRGLSSNTKFYVVCLLSEREYMEHLLPVVNVYWTQMVYSYWIVVGSGWNFSRLVLKQKPCTFYFMTVTKETYELLGPSYARRNNCSGLLRIARGMKVDGARGTVQTSPPAKEERSSVLRIACVLVAYNGKLNCEVGALRGTVQVMKNYLNITKSIGIPVRTLTHEKDKLPEKESFPGSLAHGIADVLFGLIAIDEAPGIESGFVLEFHKLIYLYPSPRMLKSSFTVLKIFSVTTWCLYGISLGLIGLLIRTAIYIEKLLACVECPGNAIPPAEKGECRKKLSVRILLMGHLLLVFMMWHCFTGGYISFLHIPLMEEAPDTKERLVAFLRDGRLEPCISQFAFVNGIFKYLNHSSMTWLSSLVQNWTLFTRTSPNICLERTSKRQAVYFGSSLFLENYAASRADEVRISRIFADDVTLPVSIYLSKASPYKEHLDNVAMRVASAGLHDKMAKRFWEHAYPPSSPLVRDEDVWQRLQLNDFELPFIVLGVGLGVGSMALLCEIFRLF